jgi:hypothetical protein
MKTDESTSNSVVGTIYHENEQKLLTFVYFNKPDATVRDRSPMHYGTCRLVVDNPLILTGDYYTDRKTTGSMKFNVLK